jgi:hypothetical protein
MKTLKKKTLRNKAKRRSLTMREGKPMYSFVSESSHFVQDYMHLTTIIAGAQVVHRKKELPAAAIQPQPPRQQFFYNKIKVFL